MALGNATVNITLNLAPLKDGLKRAKVSVSAFRTEATSNMRKFSRAAARGFKSLARVAKRAASGIKRAFRSAFAFLRSGFNKIISLSKITAAALLGIAIASVKVASDTQETDNLFKISMGSMADSAATFARDYSKSLGLFENDSRKALGTFQLMLTSMGIAEDKAFDMSKGLVRLTNDIASFRNQRPQDIFLKLQAGITGEAEPLKRLGILVNETIIKQIAMEKGIIKTNNALDKSSRSLNIQSDGQLLLAKSTNKASRELTDAQKVLLRYEAITRATIKDQGDMKRTLNETANVFRTITAQIKRTAETIGNVLLPPVNKIAVVIRDWLKSNQPLFEAWATSAVKAVTAVTDKLTEYFNLAKQGKFSDIFADITNIFVGITGKIATSLEGVAASIKEKLKEAGNSIVLGGLEELGRNLARITIALTSIITDVIKFVTPLFVDLGRQIGKGFIDVMKDTKVGKFFKGAGKVLEVATAPVRLQAQIAGKVAAPFLGGGRPIGLAPATQAGVDSGELQRLMLRELQILNEKTRRPERGDL